MLQKRRRDGNHVYTEEGKPPSIVLDDVHITIVDKPKKARMVTQSYGIKRTDAHPPPPDTPSMLVADVPFHATEMIISDNEDDPNGNSEDPPQPKKVCVILY